MGDGKELPGAQRPAGGALGTSANAEIWNRLKQDPKVLIGGGAAAILVLVVVVFVIVRIASPSSAPATETSNADESPGTGIEGELRTYFRAIKQAERELPLDEAREAMEGIGEEARVGKLDVGVRRAKLDKLEATMRAQRDKVAALPFPDVALVHRQAVLNWYDRWSRMSEVLRDQLRLYNEINALVARKHEVTNAEEAASLREDAKTAQENVQRTLDSTRQLSAQLKGFVEQKDAEERRLSAEYKLPAPTPAQAEEAVTKDAWCQSILQMGGTLENCEAARSRH